MEYKRMHFQELCFNNNPPNPTRYAMGCNILANEIGSVVLQNILLDFSTFFVANVGFLNERSRCTRGRGEEDMKVFWGIRN